jgi:hypothetical protein
VLIYRNLQDFSLQEFGNVENRLGRRLTSTTTEAPADLQRHISDAYYMHTRNSTWFAYLVRHLNVLLQLISPREDQARVLLETSANRDDIETILLKQIIREVSVIDHANNTDSQLVANSLLDFDSERSLVSRASVRVLQRVVATRADVQHIDTLVRQNAGELHGVVYGPGFRDLGYFFEPVGGGDAEEERHVLGNDRASLFGELDGDASAVFEAAAVLVGTVVGDGRDEGVDEVAVGLAIVSKVANVIFPNNLHHESQ